MPNGKNLSILNTFRGRYNTNQDAALQEGDSERVDRMLSANNRGKTGPRGIAHFPPFQGGIDGIQIGHIPTFRPVRGVTLTPSHTVDDNAHIPAIMAGNPLE